MTRLPNRRQEWFAQYVAAGIPLPDAYVKAGYTRSRANHCRLKRKPGVAARVEELQRESDRVARAARTPVEEVPQTLRECVGVVRVADFFQQGLLAPLSLVGSHRLGAM
jgi:hypothetical protein